MEPSIYEVGTMQVHKESYIIEVPYVVELEGPLNRAYFWLIPLIRFRESNPLREYDIIEVACWVELRSTLRGPYLFLVPSVRKGGEEDFKGC